MLDRDAENARYENAAQKCRGKNFGIGNSRKMYGKPRRRNCRCVTTHHVLTMRLRVFTLLWRTEVPYHKSFTVSRTPAAIDDRHWGWHTRLIIRPRYGQSSYQETRQHRLWRMYENVYRQTGQWFFHMCTGLLTVYFWKPLAIQIAMLSIKSIFNTTAYTNSKKYCNTNTAIFIHVALHINTNRLLSLRFTIAT